MSQEPSIYNIVEPHLRGLGDRAPASPDRGALPNAVRKQGPRIRAAIVGAIREPLVHFLVIGGLLFGGSAILDRSTTFGGRYKQIDVSAARLQQLRETWTARWGAPPDSQQMRTLVDDFVREEVLYREAIASGLDRDDTIIRRHLAQKVEFLAQGVSAANEPTDAALQQYFGTHRDRYADPAKVAFSHVYFNVGRRGASASDTAMGVLARLRADPASAATASLGDAFMLQSEYPPQTHAEIRDLFGVEFATQLFTLTPGEWRGPVRSSYGFHLVRIDQAIPPGVPDFESVRSRVTEDFAEQRARSAVDAYYETLRARYKIHVAPLEPNAP